MGRTSNTSKISTLKQYELQEQGINLSGVYTKVVDAKDRFTGMFKSDNPGDRMLDPALFSITTGRTHWALSQVSLPQAVKVSHVDPEFSVDLSSSPTLELPLAAAPVAPTNK